MNSLRRRVALWLFPPLAILMIIDATLSYQEAFNAVNFAYDRTLAASIKSISDNSYVRDGKFVVDIPYSALEMFSEGAQESVFYSVIGPNGAVITGYPDLPVIKVPADGALKTGDASYKGDAVRVGAMRKRIYDPAFDNATLTVVVAETTESRVALTQQLFGDSLRHQLALLIGSILVLLTVLTYAFRPLLRLRDRLLERTAEDLTPIAAEEIPSEIRPLIDAINHHMARIAAMVEARKRFLADAAHQLRTPLSVLAMQADYGLRQEDAAEMRQALLGLRQSIRSTRRLANQMLTLSRAEAANSQALDWNPVDLLGVAREVALELAPLALARKIDLGFEAAPDSVTVFGNRAMLHEMVANLVDNAIRYSPVDGKVTVSVSTAGAQAVLVVSDTGPGIPPEEHENVFKRFYRILGRSDSEGSGLGLAIVREICTVHQGDISLGNPVCTTGLVVTIHLPLRPSQPAV